MPSDLLESNHDVYFVDSSHNRVKEEKMNVKRVDCSPFLCFRLRPQTRPTFHLPEKATDFNNFPAR
jgi:hypothetical protein